MLNNNLSANNYFGAEKNLKQEEEKKLLNPELKS